MTAPAAFLNAVMRAVQENTEPFIPFSQRTAAAKAAWASVEPFIRSCDEPWPTPDSGRTP